MNLTRRWGKIVLVVAGLIVAIFGVMFGVSVMAVRGTFAKLQPASQAGGTAVVAGAAGHHIAGRFYVTGTPNPVAPLVVVLHGDAPFTNPRYQYGFASDVADAVPGTRVVALLRPGYADPYGAKSDGDRGFSSGENYTAEVESDVAAAIRSLKTQWGAPSVILVGHSGGAAVAANVAALSPGLVQHIFLVGCPCDVPAFRRHMARLQWGPMWLIPAKSLSPIETLEQMSKATRVTAISGANDPLTLPTYARAYIARANAQGISASMMTIPAKGHEILNEPAVVSEVAKAVRDGG